LQSELQGLKDKPSANKSDCKAACGVNVKKVYKFALQPGNLTVQVAGEHQP